MTTILSFKMDNAEKLGFCAVYFTYPTSKDWKPLDNIALAFSNSASSRTQIGNTKILLWTNGKLFPSPPIFVYNHPTYALCERLVLDIKLIC